MLNGKDFYRTQVNLGLDDRTRSFADLTDVTLEDTNSILTNNANRAIQGNMLMQVMQPADQCKLCHLVAKFATNASDAIWWPILQLMQVGT